MTPDLDNDPMVMLAMAAVLGMIALALWLYERKHDGRDTRSSADARMDRDRSVSVGARGLRRGVRARAVEQRRDAASARRSVRAAVRPEHHRLLDLHEQVALTDDELLALARYLDLTSRNTSALALLDAETPIRKVMRAASDVLHGDRVSRR